MGMLLHHTWLKQHEAMKAKTAVEEVPFNEPVTEQEEEATAEAEAPKATKRTETKKAPARKPAAKRKTSK